MIRIKEELQLLQSFCGKTDASALQSIDWDSDYTFSNGCKAPPWRQILGDLAYIRVNPKDGNKIIVTATRNGFLVNNGYKVDAAGSINDV
jgi:hypothetical protein